MTVMQVAVLPGRERLWTMGDDLLVGFAVKASDAAWATTPTELFGVHGLGFPGSPFSPESTAVDVLRFPVTPYARFVNATGTQAPADLPPGSPGEGFVQPAPFTGNGFAPVPEQRFVPMWWVEPMRVPGGSELWRIHADGREELISAYPNIASGWLPSQPTGMAPSDVFGVFGTWRGQRVMVDILPNGATVIASPVQVEGLHLTERGLWAASVDATEVSSIHTLRLTCTWNGLPFQIIRRWQTENGPVARLLFTGRDSRVAESAGLEKTDNGVYEASVALSELADVQGVELTPAP